MISMPVLTSCRAAKTWLTSVLPAGSPIMACQKWVANFRARSCLPGVPERGPERESLTGAEAIEGDRKVVDMNLGHGASSTNGADFE